MLRNRIVTSFFVGRPSNRIPNRCPALNDLGLRNERTSFKRAELERIAIAFLQDNGIEYNSLKLNQYRSHETKTNKAASGRRTPKSGELRVMFV